MSALTLLILALLLQRRRGRNHAEFYFKFTTEGSSVVASDDSFIFGVFHDCREVEDLRFVIAIRACAEENPDLLVGVEHVDAFTLVRQDS